MSNQPEYTAANLKDMAQHSDLAIRQAVANQYHSPQSDFGSLVAVVEQQKPQ